MNVEHNYKWIEKIESLIRANRYIEIQLTQITCGPPKKNQRLTLLRVNRKRLYLILRSIRRCPECYGRKYIEDWIDDEYYRTINCPTCNGTGKLQKRTGIGK